MFNLFKSEVKRIPLSSNIFRILSKLFITITTFYEYTNIITNISIFVKTVSCFFSKIILTFNQFAISILFISSLAILELSSRMILSSALPKLNKLILPYQTTL